MKLISFGTRILTATPAVLLKAINACASGCGRHYSFASMSVDWRPRQRSVLGGGGDLVHADPEYDMGITGGLEDRPLLSGARTRHCNITPVGPAHRAVMAATPNTHFYEMALVGPDMPNTVPPVYACGYSDQPQDLGSDGCVPVPDGSGLGVTTTGTSSNAPG